MHPALSFCHVVSSQREVQHMLPWAPPIFCIKADERQPQASCQPRAAQHAAALWQDVLLAGIMQRKIQLWHYMPAVTKPIGRSSSCTVFDINSFS